MFDYDNHVALCLIHFDLALYLNRLFIIIIALIDFKLIDVV